MRVSCRFIRQDEQNRRVDPALEKNTADFSKPGTDYAKASGMPCLLDNLRSLESAQGYASLGLYMQANQELEQMSPDTRLLPEVLAVFDGLNLWEMVEIVAMQLSDSAAGNPRWISIAETARQETRAALQRERSGSRGLFPTPYKCFSSRRG